ncbi:MAG: hypothetical protein ACEQSL_00665 [Sediminibacterium sp.]
MSESDFKFFMDCLMWEGYAERYRIEFPREYYDELIEFLNLHNNGKDNYTGEAAAA